MVLYLDKYNQAEVLISAEESDIIQLGIRIVRREELRGHHVGSVD
jgi:hypothetical protein